MGALETNTSLIYGVHIRESATDGSDFTNAAADYRVLFLGEDGLLHVKDSAGTVTSPFTSATSYAQPTIDSSGVNGASTTSLAVTISAAASGKRLVVIVFSNARDVNTPTCTNVTFTEVLSSVFSTTCYLSVYVGVATGTTGTTVTITATGSNTINAVVDTISNTLTPTAGTPATVNNTDAATITGTLLGPITPAAGTFWIAAAAQVTNTTPLLFRASQPFVSTFVRSTLASGAATNFVYGYGISLGGSVIAWTEGGTSGADYAGGIVGIT